jgi:alpha-galactosidase
MFRLSILKRRKCNLFLPSINKNYNRMDVRKSYMLFLAITLACLHSVPASAFQNNNGPGNAKYAVTWPQKSIRSFTYHVKANNTKLDITLPSFEINGTVLPAVLLDLKVAAPPAVLKNAVTEYVYEGVFQNQPSLQLEVRFQVAPDNAVLRFRYRLRTAQAMRLTKTSGKDRLTYLSFQAPGTDVKEVRLSEFNERFHATHRTEAQFDKRYFNNATTLMGPLVVVPARQSTFVMAYEHGSQYPDRFLEFQLFADRQIRLNAVKGNYLNEQV